jgi:hypothetical protein
VFKKRFIFTVTSGRTGTGYLAHLLGIFRNTDTYHEPAPAYDLVLREVQHHPEIAHSFLVNSKIPAILGMSASSIYIETSHLFSKGFLEPWLNIPGLPVPDIILLTRDHREVSLSFLSLNSIPGKSNKGMRFMLAPSDPSCFTEVDGWESFNDYQLCYWYCLETAERRSQYRALIQSKGGRTFSTSIDRLQTLSGFLDAKKQLELPNLTAHGWVGYLRRRSERINRRENAKSEIFLDVHDLAVWEEDVRKRTHPKEHKWQGRLDVQYMESFSSSQRQP